MLTKDKKKEIKNALIIRCLPHPIDITAQENIPDVPQKLIRMIALRLTV